MASSPKNRIELADLIDLETQLRLDASLDRQELRERDRAIGREIGVQAQGRRGLVLAWLERMRLDSPDLPGARASSAIAAASGLLALLGLALGFGAAKVVFAYDGSRPINVIDVLVVFVVIEWLLLLLLGAAVLPHGWIGRLPGASAAQDVLRALSPGRLVALVGRILPSGYRQALGQASGQWAVFDRLYGSVRLWLVVRVAQGFAIAFYLGALLGCLRLIFFSDLAFAWSTTLQIDPCDFHQALKALAAPWGWLVPDAVPSLELVETSRYFRHGEAYLGGAPDVEGLGGWWPFLVASMAFYGLLPRLIIWALAAWRFRASLDRVRLDHAPCLCLCERLIEPLVESRAPNGEATRIGPNPLSGLVPEAGAVRQGACFAIDWGNPPIPDEAIERFLRGRGLEPMTAFERAGGLEVEQDARALERLESAFTRKGEERAVALFVKAWESPTRDFARFLEAVRRRVGEGTPLLVVAVDRHEGAAVAAEAGDIEHWRSKMNELGDPWLRTANYTEER